MHSVEHSPAVAEQPEVERPRGVRPRGLFVLDPEALEEIYEPASREAIAEMIDLVGPPRTAQEIQRNPELLKDVEVLISGWGGPRLDRRVLDHAPHLRMVFYGAGSIRTIMTEEAWRRGIGITSAWKANAIPVAEFTLAQIIFCLRGVWRHVFHLRQTHRWEQLPGDAGTFGSRVGIVSLGEIGRRVCQYLQPLDVEVVAYDVHPDPALASVLDIRYVDLEELFATSDVVSLHTAYVPATRGMITGRLIASMKAGAALINTARGGLIDQPAMIEVLKRRPDLLAVLDVTDPEPPEEDSELWRLPNVILTPHIAGSRGREAGRMGRYMVEEIRRYVQGQPLKWLIRPEQAVWMA